MIDDLVSVDRAALKQAMYDRGLSQSAVAARIGIHDSAFSLILSGKREVRIGEAVALASVLGAALDQIASILGADISRLPPDSRIAAIEAQHDARVSELLLANGREVESRRRANRERDMAQTMLRAIAGALMKAETERDNANRMMRGVLAARGEDETMTIEDGTEAHQS